jgi:hypothetical protein
MATSESYHDYLIERLKNPVEAQAYLQTAYEEYSEDGDMEMFWIAQNNIIEAGHEEIIVKNIDLIASKLKKKHSERKNISAISE